MNPRILIALPGLHRVNRGAEVAFEQIARGLCRQGFPVTLIGSGEPRPGTPYRFLHAPIRPRERFRNWPSFPPFRGEYRWEEASFAPGLWRAYRPEEYDITLTCSYPFTQWVLRGKRRQGRPLHVYVTENSDWAAVTRNREYRWFGCEGLVCTNPEYYERNQERWRAALIPNGVDTALFTPAPPPPGAFGIPDGAPVVCMVSALIPSKHPESGIRAVAQLPGVHLLLAGDGPLRESCDRLGQELLGERYHRVTVPMTQMPEVYRRGQVFLHLSREEAFGNIYIEALACGLPVVAHDTPTTRWILEEHGRCLDTAHLEAVSAALAECLAAPADPAAQQARHLAAATRFAWDKVSTQYADFLRSLL